MKIEPIEMFATPKSWKEVERWIEAHAPEERAHLYTAALMTWNLAVHLNGKSEVAPPQ